MHFLPIPAGSVAQVCVSVTRWIIWNIPTTARERIWTTVGTPINSTAHTRLFRVHNTNCAAKRCTRRQCRRVRQALSLGRFDVSTAASGAPLHAAGLDHSTEAKWVPRRGAAALGRPVAAGLCSREAARWGPGPAGDAAPAAAATPRSFPGNASDWAPAGGGRAEPSWAHLRELGASVPTGGPGPSPSVSPPAP